MPKSPYQFTARSRVAMIAAIQAIEEKRYYEHKSWPFCWNVKLPYEARANEAALLSSFADGDEPFNPAWDEPWLAEMQSDGFDCRLIEDMRFVVDDLTDYDGNEFETYFLGRSGGWLVLKSGLGFDFAGFDTDELSDKEAYSFADVKALYRALVTFESDFSRDKVRAQMLHCIAFMRSRWEEDRIEMLGDLASDIFEARATVRKLIVEYRNWRPVLRGMMTKGLMRAEIKRLMRAQRDDRKTFANIFEGNDSCAGE